MCYEDRCQIYPCSCHLDDDIPASRLLPDRRCYTAHFHLLPIRKIQQHLSSCTFVQLLANYCQLERCLFRFLPPVRWTDDMLLLTCGQICRCYIAHGVSYRGQCKCQSSHKVTRVIIMVLADVEGGVGRSVCRGMTVYLLMCDRGDTLYSVNVAV